MRDEIIDGTWAKAADGWTDDRTVGIYVNLRQADSLIARRAEDGKRFHLCAVYGAGRDGRPGIAVPLALAERYTARDICKDLDNLVEHLAATPPRR